MIVGPLVENRHEGSISQTLTMTAMIEVTEDDLVELHSSGII